MERLVDVCVYADADERSGLFEYLDQLPVEYHKEYKRFNKIVKVPRGQASFTLSLEIMEPFAKSKESHARLDLPWASHRWHRWRCGAFAPCVR